MEELSGEAASSVNLSGEINGSDGAGSGEGGGSGENDEEDPLEFVHVNEDFFYMAHVMRLAALLHSLVSLAMLIAYYHLKVHF